MSLTIHTDGGSRGNPGPAASAYVIEDGPKLVKEGSVFLGITTNNVAEYMGVIAALDWLLQNKRSDWNEIFFILDSELVVKQLKGVYKVKDVNLQSLHKKILEKIISLKINTNFKNVPRSLNKRADFLVNQELDKNI